MQFEDKYVLIDNVNIHYVTAEPNNDECVADKTFVFLHGFPEYWQTWQSQLEFFSKNSHVIAPDLPGYNLSDKPQDTSFYEVSNLIQFMIKFIIEVSPTEKIYLIAHDWGGAIAWPIAAFYPQYIEKLIILNAAHPSTFTREMINNPVQRNKSEYIHELISKHAETILSQDNFLYLSEKMLMNHTSINYNEDTMARYKRAWQQPGAVNGMLQYYRAMPQLAASNKIDNQQHNYELNGPIVKTVEMKIPNIRINVPTLILWGEQDQAFVKENLDGIKQYVPNCTIERFETASHWLMHEVPFEINEAIIRFIKT